MCQKEYTGNCMEFNNKWNRGLKMNIFRISKVEFWQVLNFRIIDSNTRLIIFLISIVFYKESLTNEYCVHSLLILIVHQIWLDCWFCQKSPFNSRNGPIECLKCKLYPYQKFEVRFLVSLVGQLNKGKVWDCGQKSYLDFKLLLFEFIGIVRV